MSSRYDVKEIREQARHSIDHGSATDDSPLDIEEACRLLNDALAREILCVLRYRHHQMIANGINNIEVATEFREHADNEELHMMALADRIEQLGGDPDFNPEKIAQRSITEYGMNRDLLGLIKDNLIAERVAIDVYRRMIEWFGTQDPTTRLLLESILADEEEHANNLADLLRSSANRN